MIVSALSNLNKADAAEDLYNGGFHVLESLDTVRSCCLLSELANDGLAAHVPQAEAQVVQLVNTLFDVLGCVQPALQLCALLCGRLRCSAGSAHLWCLKRRRGIQAASLLPSTRIPPAPYHVTRPSFPPAAPTSPLQAEHAQGAGGARHQRHPGRAGGAVPRHHGHRAGVPAAPAQEGEDAAPAGQTAGRQGRTAPRDITPHPLPFPSPAPPRSACAGGGPARRGGVCCGAAPLLRQAVHARGADAASVPHLH